MGHVTPKTSTSQHIENLTGWSEILENLPK